MECPHCGGECRLPEGIVLEPVGKRKGGPLLKLFRSSAQAHSHIEQVAAPPAPAEPRSATGDKVSLRFRQATALWLLTVMTGGAFVAGKSGWLGPMGLPIVCGGMLCWAVFFVSLFGLDLLQFGLDAMERRTGRDLDGDGRIGGVETVRVEFAERTDGGHSLKWLDLPVDSDRLRDFAQGVAQGESLAESRWTGADQPFSRSEYAELRDVLILRGFARWRNASTPARGWELTRKGEALIRTLADVPPPYRGVGEATH